MGVDSIVNSSVNNVVIVGGGLAATRVAEQLRRSQYVGAVTIVSDEQHLPYDRPPLSKTVLSGTAEQIDVTLKPQAFYDEKDITLRLGTAVAAVDTAARTLTLAGGELLEYGELVIATGLSPKRIGSLPDIDGIFVVRSLEDSLSLRSAARSATNAVIVGAGFIGCEVAASLRGLGVNVVLVEPQPQPLASVLGEQIGALVSRLHRDAGVDVRTGVGVAQVLGESAVRAVVLSDGTEVPADLVVVGIGSTPVTGFLAGSGIELAANGGVRCDAVGRAAEHVWAIGDVASWAGPEGADVRVEHWSNVAEQARVLVPALLGEQPAPAVVVPYFWSDQYDVKLQCLGEPSAGDIVHIVEDDGRKFLAYYERDGAVAGVVGCGMPGKVMKARAKIAASAPIAEVLEV